MVKTTQAKALPQTGLVIFTDQLATLIETGVSCDQALAALVDAPHPYGTVAQEMRREIEQEEGPETEFYMAESYFLDQLHNPDAYPNLIERLEQAANQKTALLPKRSQALSKAMSKRPEVFPAFLVDLARAGETRGLLDVTLRTAQGLLDKDWELAGRRVKGEPPVLALAVAEGERPKDWSDLTDYRQKQVLALFLRTFGALLASGVPILQAMRTVANVLPARTTDGWNSAIEAVKKGESIVSALERMTIFPAFSIALIGVGEEGGFLDTSLERAADLIERDMARERWAAES